MIRIAIALAAIAVAGLLKAADESPAALVEGSKIPELTLPGGQTYKDVTIRKVMPEGISILHADGAKMIYATELPDDLRSAGTFLNADQIAARREAEAKAAEAEEADRLAARKAASTNFVPYVSPAQVKKYWVAKIPVPDPLSASYQSEVVSRMGLMDRIKAGDYDLKIERSAASWNKDLAIQAKDADKTYYYDSEIARIDKAIAEKARLEADNAYRAKLLKALDDLDADIRQATAAASTSAQ